MKYVMLEETHPGGMKRKIPIIFPSDLVHVVVAQAIMSHREMRHRELKVFSAGTCLLRYMSVGGESETLGVKSDPGDEEVLISYEYLHGL